MILRTQKQLAQSLTTKILVVDDEQEILEILSMQFQGLGYDVQSATSGNKALTKISTFKPDVIISDIQMPDGSGQELFIELKKLRPDYFPIFLFVSGGCSTTFDFIHFFDDGLKAYISKPFNMKKVVKIVERLLVSNTEKWLAPCTDTSKTSFSATLPSWDNAILSKEISFGSGGFCLSCKLNPDLQDKLVTFKIDFESGEPSLFGKGIIQWVGTNEVGIEFIQLQKASVDYLITRHKIFDLVPYIPTLGKQ